MQQPVAGGEGERVSQSEVRNIKVRIPRPQFLTKLLVVIKILTGLSLLALSTQGVQWGNLVTGFRSANFAWLVMVILAVLFGLFLKIWRWAVFLKNYHVRVSAARLFSAYFVGQAVNIILPLRGGEIVRIGYFAGEPDILPEITSTVVLEKYLDLLAFVVCVILVSLKFSIDNILSLRSWLFPLTGIFTLVLLVAIVFGPAIWKKIRAGNLLPKRIVEWIDRWVETQHVAEKPKTGASSDIANYPYLECDVVDKFTSVKSLGLPANGTAAGLVLTLVYVGLFPALMPGNIGPFYFFARVALLPFGIIHDQAFIYAVVLHAIVTLPPLLGGAIGLMVRSNRQVVL